MRASEARELDGGEAPESGISGDLERGREVGREGRGERTGEPVADWGDRGWKGVGKRRDRLTKEGD